jgi:hypothetical protein
MAPKRNYFKSKGKVETKEDSKLKDNSQEQQNTTKDQGMISELPVLTYADNKPNNHLIFKEKILLSARDTERLCCSSIVESFELLPCRINQKQHSILMIDDIFLTGMSTITSEKGELSYKCRESYRHANGNVPHNLR